MNTNAFKKLIKEKAGLAFDKSLSNLLTDEISTRMQAVGITQTELYYKHVVNDPQEFCKLLNLLTVNETYFFREPAYIKIFSENLIPTLLRQKNFPIKILSAGCSTGEEPYTLAIALHDKYGQGFRNLFSIYGVDLDSDVILQAQQGCYPQTSFRTMNPKFTAHYFNANEKHYTIKTVIKESVQFQTLNLLAKKFPHHLSDFDIIFYRNVSIYFDENIQKQIFTRLAEILLPSGFLIVSATETLSHDYSMLKLIELDGIFLYHKPAFMEKIRVSPQIPTQNRIDRTKQPSLKARAMHTSTNKNLSTANYKKALVFAKTKKYQEALNMIEVGPDTKDALALKANILINLNEFVAAEKICDVLIQKDQLCMEAYFLLGLIAKYKDKSDQAVKKFKECIYLHDTNWLAHYYLADIYKSRGESERAAHQYQIVIKLLQKAGFEKHGLSFFPFSFSKDQMMHLCKINLDGLNAKGE